MKKLWDKGYELNKLVDSFTVNNDNELDEKLDTNTFDRTSIKFWVSRENIIPFILEVIQHLPVYIYDEDVNEHISKLVELQKTSLKVHT